MTPLSQLIETDHLTFIEPDYASLINNGEPATLICEAKPDHGNARMLIDENEHPTLFAVKADETWYATSWLYRTPTKQELQLFDRIEGDIYQEPRDTIEKAFRQEFAEKLTATTTPAQEDLTTDRIEKTRSLLQEKFGTTLNGTCIDACCGSGLGSAIMRDLGCTPLSYDNDKELLALGITAGRLHTDETICIDGRIASAYLPDAEYGIGLMFGQIYTYTKELWQPLVEELAGITKKTLITVATEEEAHWVKEWAAGIGRTLNISENTRDPIYDRWICFG